MASNHAIANALYTGEASDQTFKEVFSKAELVDLWDNHCAYKRDDTGEIVAPNAPYDDEVYNALDRYGFWDNK